MSVRSRLLVRLSFAGLWLCAVCFSFAALAGELLR